MKKFINAVDSTFLNKSRRYAQDTNDLNVKMYLLILKIIFINTYIICLNSSLEDNEADSAIEKLVTDPKLEEKFHYAMVITSDIALRERIMPVFFQRSQEFIKEIHEADKEW